MSLASPVKMTPMLQSNKIKQPGDSQWARSVTMNSQAVSNWFPAPFILLLILDASLHLLELGAETGAFAAPSSGSPVELMLSHNPPLQTKPPDP